MVELNNYINILKIGLIRRLIATNSKYKILFETNYTRIKELMSRGATYIEEIKRRCTNTFWWDVLQHGNNLLHSWYQNLPRILWVLVYGTVYI